MCNGTVLKKTEGGSQMHCLSDLPGLVLTYSHLLKLLGLIGAAETECKPKGTQTESSSEMKTSI